MEAANLVSGLTRFQVLGSQSLRVHVLIVCIYTYIHNIYIYTHTYIYIWSLSQGHGLSTGGGGGEHIHTYIYIYTHTLAYCSPYLGTLKPEYILFRYMHLSSVASWGSVPRRSGFIGRI